MAHGKARNRDFYARQLHDMKMSIVMEAMDKSSLCHYAKLCGHVLARAHARTADPAVIGGYMGKSVRRGDCGIRVGPSKQTNGGYESLTRAVREGRMDAASSWSKPLYRF